MSGQVLQIVMWNLGGLGDFKLLLDNLIGGLSGLGLGLLEGMSGGSFRVGSSKGFLVFNYFFPLAADKSNFIPLIMIFHASGPFVAASGLLI